MSVIDMEPSGHRDYIDAIRRASIEELLENIPHDLLIDLQRQFDQIPSITSSLIKEKGIVTTDDVMKILDDQFIISDSEVDVALGRLNMDRSYKENKDAILELISVYYPDDGTINKGRELYDDIVHYLKSKPE